jgi:hypothetical protein
MALERGNAPYEWEYSMKSYTPTSGPHLVYPSHFRRGFKGRGDSLRDI